MQFDRYARDYETVVDQAAGVSVTKLAAEKARLVLDVLRTQIGSPKELRVLDIGCGVGLIDRELERDVGVLCAVDVSTDSLEIACRKAPATHFTQYDGTHLPFADGFFDAVFASCVVHHVPAPARTDFMVEMLRPLRTGGTAVLIEHNPFNPVTQIIVSRCAFDADAVLLSCREAARLLKTAGAPATGRRYVGFSPVRNAFIEKAERALGWLPAGAQYCIWGVKNSAV